MIIGYRLTGHDNDSYMLGEETRLAASAQEREFFDWRFTQNGGQHPATCPKCGRKTDPDYLNPDFRLRRKHLDVSSTYDGYTIVSDRFRRFCGATSIAHVEFVSLPSQSTHFWFRVHRVLEVDSQASLGLRCLSFCDRCQTYTGVFGTSRLQFTGVDTTLPKGISCTDLEFGQTHEQAPVIVLDTELAEVLEAEKFRGLCLSKIEI